MRRMDTGILRVAVCAAVAACACSITAASDDEHPQPRIDVQTFSLIAYEVVTPRHRRNPSSLIIAKAAGELRLHTATLADRVLLHDTWELLEPARRIELRHHYTDASLERLRQVDVTAIQGTTLATVTLTMTEDGRASLTVHPPREGEAARVVDYPADTQSFAALLRQVRGLPREKGARQEVRQVAEAMGVSLLRGPDDAAPPAWVCDGEVSLQLSGKPTTCTQFTLDFGAVRDPWRFWVDGEGRLRQFALGLTLLGTSDAHDFAASHPLIDELLRRHRPADAETAAAEE